MFPYYSTNCMEKYEILSFSHFLTLEDKTDRSSHNVGKELPVYAMKYSRRAQISPTL